MYRSAESAPYSSLAQAETATDEVPRAVRAHGVNRVRPLNLGGLTPRSPPAAPAGDAGSRVVEAGEVIENDDETWRCCC